MSMFALSVAGFSVVKLFNAVSCLVKIYLCFNLYLIWCCAFFVNFTVSIRMLDLKSFFFGSFCR